MEEDLASNSLRNRPPQSPNQHLFNLDSLVQGSSAHARRRKPVPDPFGIARQVKQSGEVPSSSQATILVLKGNPSQGRDTAESRSSESPPEVTPASNSEDTTLQVSTSHVVSNPGLSSHLPQVEEEAVCSICFGLFSSPSTLLPCGHKFDFNCIIPWLESLYRITPDLSRLTCPLCRGVVEKIQHGHQPDGSSLTLDIKLHFRYYGHREGRRSSVAAAPGRGFGSVPILMGPPPILNRGETFGRVGRRATSNVFPAYLTEGDAEWPEIETSVSLTAGQQMEEELERMGEGSSNDLDSSYTRWGRVTGERFRDREFATQGTQRDRR